jgi:hypothetical protein
VMAAPEARRVNQRRFPDFHASQCRHTMPTPIAHLNLRQTQQSILCIR